MVNVKPIDKKEKVKAFLIQLKIEVRAGNFRVIKRKNESRDYLREFGWTPSIFFDFLCDNLTYEDWLNGPVDDLNGTPGNIWEFGKYINGIEFYIKIKECSGVKCLSFHEARRPCMYHLKGK